MSTINRSMAEELIKSNGKAKFGTAGYCLVRYQNRTKYDLPGVDFYNPDAENNVFDYAIFSTKAKYEKFLESDMVGGVDILWGSRKFIKDESKQELAAEQEDLAEGALGYSEEYIRHGKER